MNNRIIQAFGFLTSPLLLSTALRDLRVSHTLVNGTLKSLGREVDLGGKQPAWPIVLPSINAISKYRCTMNPQILLVCDAESRFKQTNIRIVKPGNIQHRLIEALEWTMFNQQSQWTLVDNEPSISDYVETATKPSLLNTMQGLFYKITPYDLRKEVQSMIIGYLAGQESRAKLMAKLTSSHKLTELATLMKDPKVVKLRDAVALYRRNGSEEKTALETGFEQFEILYISRSSEKAKANVKKKK